MPFIDVRTGNARQGFHLLMSGQEMLGRDAIYCCQNRKHLLMSEQEMLDRDAIY